MTAIVQRTYRPCTDAKELIRLPSRRTLVLLADNKLLIVKLGGLEPLIRQMLSPNVEVQCNAVGCITNLATHGE